MLSALHILPVGRKGYPRTRCARRERQGRGSVKCRGPHTSVKEPERRTLASLEACLSPPRLCLHTAWRHSWARALRGEP
jgi:hypothetical protein